MNIKDLAIETCLMAREKAVLIKNHHTKVGACIYTDNNEMYIGFNVQNKCHKSYHAEELAILDCILHNVNPNSIQGIVVSFSANNIKRLTFCCGHCRQYLWEYTMNPNLLVTEVDLIGNIIKEVKLNKLYPYPYPYPR